MSRVGDSIRELNRLQTKLKKKTAEIQKLLEEAKADLGTKFLVSPAPSAPIHIFDKTLDSLGDYIHRNSKNDMKLFLDGAKTLEQDFEDWDNWEALAPERELAKKAKEERGERIEKAVSSACSEILEVPVKYLGMLKGNNISSVSVEIDGKTITPNIDLLSRASNNLDTKLKNLVGSLSRFKSESEEIEAIFVEAVTYFMTTSREVIFAARAYRLGEDEAQVLEILDNICP